MTAWIFLNLYQVRHALAVASVSLSPQQARQVPACPPLLKALAYALLCELSCFPTSSDVE